MTADRDAHRSRRRRQRCMQPAALRQGHRHRRARAVEARARRPVGVPVHQLDEASFIGEWRWDGMPAATLEDETRARAVDSHLLHVGIGEVLCQWAKRGHRSKDAAPQKLGLVDGDRRRCLPLLLAHNAADLLVDPLLVLDMQPGAVPACQLGRELGFDERPDAPFCCRKGGGRCSHGHLRVAEREAARAMASSALATGISAPSAAPGSTTTAARCIVAAAKTNAAATFAGTATMSPPEAAATTSTPSANGATVG